MKDSLRTIIFAAALGTACAGLLTAANHVLKPYQKANAAAEKLRNIFGVLDVPCEEDANSTVLLRLVKTDDNPDGKVVKSEVDGMEIYSYEHPDAGRLYAVQFSGSGMWGPVKGLLCLRSDLATIYNIAFYKQEETPGLGAEIAGDKFCGQFRDKTIAGETPGISVRAAGAATAAGPNEVDGISGATITGGKAQAMINAISERIAENRDAILKEVGNE